MTAHVIHSILRGGGLIFGGSEKISAAPSAPEEGVTAYWSAVGGYLQHGINELNAAHPELARKVEQAYYERRREAILQELRQILAEESAPRAESSESSAEQFEFELDCVR